MGGELMPRLKIGVMVESFRLPLRDGIEKAAEIGADGIQVYAVKGETDLDKLKGDARREFKEFVASRGLKISALCGDLGGHGFERASDNEWKVEKSKRVMDMAVELGTDVVTTHVGCIPEEPKDERYVNIKAACEELASYGDKVGAAFAIETGPETVEGLKSFLDGLSARGVRVNYDPANLVMVTGDDAVAGVKKLKDYIVHTHAKDGVKKCDIDPETLYGWFADGGIKDVRLSDYFLETPLGEGKVDFPAYIRALREVGYGGFFTIEREVGENPEADIKKAMVFLRELEKNL